MSHPSVQYVPGGDASNLTADGLIDLFHSLPPAYRNVGAWMMNSKTVGAVRKLKSSTGNYLWVDSLVAGNPPTILSRPVIEAVDMPDIGANAFPIVFGDFNSGYRIYDRIGLTILRDPFTQATNGLVRFHARRRVGGDVVKAEALRKLKISVS
jgi:HK97 family phage major capsid protein